MAKRTDPDVTVVADSVVALAGLVRRSRARLIAAARTDVESAAQLLLRTVANEGPMRASSMAESVHTDLSTVSRQVSALVARGLLERRADPEDGRACLLALTEAGEAVVDQHAQIRMKFFHQVLADWSPAELRSFAGSLERFTAAYEQTHAAWTRGSHPDSPEGTTA